MITSEPLVEVAVRQFRERAREGFLFAVPPGAVASGSGEEASKKTKPSAMERSSTELRFASFLAPLCGVGRAVKGQDERQKMGALDSPSQPKRKSVLHFSLDMADDFIDGR